VIHISATTPRIVPQLVELLCSQLPMVEELEQMVVHGLEEQEALE
jgi:hypothetical protein